MIEFKPGDIVRLKEYKGVMTVTAVTKTDCLCIWKDMMQKNGLWFNKNKLEIIGKGERKEDPPDIESILEGLEKRMKEVEGDLKRLSKAVGDIPRIRR